jgi:hypothetical protein
MVSTHVGETVVLECLGLMLAGRPKHLFNYEGGYSSFLLADSPASLGRSLWQGNGVRLPEHATGIGPVLDPHKLRQYARQSEFF